MPRRPTPDPLALRIGQRIRRLRQRAGLSLEKLAYESELGSKGHLSDLERGLTRPTITTLQALADRLGVALFDLVAFPEDGQRERLVEALRELPPPELERLARRYAPGDAAFLVGERPKERSEALVRLLGRRLREARAASGRRPEAIAAAAGLDTEAYLALEAGEGDPSVRALAGLAEALGVAVWELFRP